MQEETIFLRQIKEGVSLVRTADGQTMIRKDVPRECYEVYRTLQQNRVPGIPQIFFLERQPDCLRVYEAYIAGPSLEDIYRNRRIATDEILKLMDSMCNVLSGIHALGLIHRDIKPEHIIQSPAGYYLVDFDAARIVCPGKSQDTQLLGTAGYASPEQFGFAQSDQRSDIYSLGKVLETIDEDHAFSRITHKALSLDPAQRYANARELQRDLHHHLFILPGFNNPTRTGRIGCIILILFCLTIALTVKDPGSFSSIFLEQIGVFMFVYLMAVAYCNRHLFERLPGGRSQSTQIGYAIVFYWFSVVLLVMLLEVFSSVF